MSRTLIDIPEELLLAAARILQTRTKKDTVVEALRRITESQARHDELDLLRQGKLADSLELANARDHGWRT